MRGIAVQLPPDTPGLEKVRGWKAAKLSCIISAGVLAEAQSPAAYPIIRRSGIPRERLFVFIDDAAMGDGHQHLGF